MIKTKKAWVRKSDNSLPICRLETGHYDRILSRGVTSLGKLEDNVPNLVNLVSVHFVPYSLCVLLEALNE